MCKNTSHQMAIKIHSFHKRLYHHKKQCIKVHVKRPYQTGNKYNTEASMKPETFLN